MKKILLIGSTNVGKTMFLINFAEYIGLHKIFMRFEYPDGRIIKKEISITNARKTLISEEAHKTKCLQSINFKLTVYKGKKGVEIIDSSGLSDGIHPDIEVREGIIQSLESIQHSNILLHMIDISSNDLIRMISEIDRQLISYGSYRGNYVLLANKIDLNDSMEGIAYLKEQYKNIYIIPISALYKLGFDEVKTFVNNSV